MHLGGREVVDLGECFSIPAGRQGDPLAPFIPHEPGLAGRESPRWYRAASGRKVADLRPLKLLAWMRRELANCVEAGGRRQERPAGILKASHYWNLGLVSAMVRRACCSAAIWGAVRPVAS